MAVCADVVYCVYRRHAFKKNEMCLSMVTSDGLPTCIMHFKTTITW